MTRRPTGSVGSLEGAGDEWVLLDDGLSSGVDRDMVVPSRIPSAGPHHRPRALTAAEREVFRKTANRSRRAKARALLGNGPEPIHEINEPALRPYDLMPQLPSNSIRALSLFSGGGGLDLGFARAGYQHAASYEVLVDAAATLVKARPDWTVFGGTDGDVTGVDWRRWRGEVDLVHGGPPCQPFSNAGRQAGQDDSRDMWPALVKCLLTVRPRAFVAENVPALATAKFNEYVRTQIIEPLGPRYRIRMLTLGAQDFGVPQARRRVVFVGFARAADDRRFVEPSPTHIWGEQYALDEIGLRRCMGLREALGGWCRTADAGRAGRRAVG